MRFATDATTGETVDAQASMTEANRTHAIVLAVGDRFFHGLGKSGRLQIAWSLAGAMLIGPWVSEAEIVAFENRLRRGGHTPVRRFVALLPEPSSALN